MAILLDVAGRNSILFLHAVAVSLRTAGPLKRRAGGLAMTYALLLASAVTFLAEEPALNYIRAWYRESEKRRSWLRVS